MYTMLIEIINVLSKIAYYLAYALSPIHQICPCFLIKTNQIKTNETNLSDWNMDQTYPHNEAIQVEWNGYPQTGKP